MAVQERLICASLDLIDGGDGIRFDVMTPGGVVPAFAVRAFGTVRAYRNQCAHVPIELDWQPGKFFDFSGLYLVCAMHGAHYDASTGYCVMGPCKGRKLSALDVIERDGNVYLKEAGDEQWRA